MKIWLRRKLALLVSPLGSSPALAWPCRCCRSHPSALYLSRLDAGSRDARMLMTARYFCSVCGEWMEDIVTIARTDVAGVCREMPLEEISA